MAAAVAQRSHDEGIPLRAQTMVYPMLDDRSTLRADHAGRGRFAWTPESNLYRLDGLPRSRAADVRCA
jgi:acetyl esterase/lipase